MDKNNKDPLYSDKYTTTDFVWGQTLGEGKSSFYIFPTLHLPVIIASKHLLIRRPTVLVLMEVSTSRQAFGLKIVERG